MTDSDFENDKDETPDIRGLFGMTDKGYNILKWIVQYILPALNTLILALGSIWNWDATVPIAATVAAIDVFLGVILGVSANQYQKNLDNK